MADGKGGGFRVEDLKRMHPDRTFRVGDTAFQELVAAAEAAARTRGPLTASSRPAEQPSKPTVTTVEPTASSAPPPQIEAKTWRISGDWFHACNGTLGCQCIWGGTPRSGTCEKIMCWSIRTGHYDGMTLDGLSVLGVVRLTGNVLSRNRDVGFLADGSADADQRHALQTIFSGRAGGRFTILADLTMNWLGFEFVPLDVTVSSNEWRAEAPGKAKIEGAPFRELMVPKDQTCELVNPPFPEGGPGSATLGRSTVNEVNAFGMSWNHPGLSSMHMPLDFTGPGQTVWTAHKGADNR